MNKMSKLAEIDIAREKNKTISKYVEESQNSFYVTLRGGPETNNTLTTDFTNKLFSGLFLKGDYEVALSSLYLSNVIDMDLGFIEINYNNNNWPYVIMLKVDAKMGEDFETIFKRINEKILEMVTEQEYNRRLQLRKISNITKTEHLLQNGDNYISVPLQNNNIYDEFVHNEIKLMSPKILLQEQHLIFQTTSEFFIKFSGNILNLIPSLTQDKLNVLSEPIPLLNKYLPDFKTIFLSTNIIEYENFGDGKQFQILKILNIDDSSRSQCINIDNNNLTFQKVKEEKNNKYHTKINEIKISIFSDLNNLLKFNQGEIIARLYFRKIWSQSKTL